MSHQDKKGVKGGKEAAGKGGKGEKGKPERRLSRGEKKGSKTDTAEGGGNRPIFDFLYVSNCNHKINNFP